MKLKQSENWVVFFGCSVYVLSKHSLANSVVFLQASKPRQYSCFGEMDTLVVNGSGK